MRFADTRVQLVHKKHSNLKQKRCFSSFQGTPSSSRKGKQHQTIYKEIFYTFAVRLFVKRTAKLQKNSFNSILKFNFFCVYYVVDNRIYCKAG